MLRNFNKVNPLGASNGVRGHMLRVAFNWLEGVDDDSLRLVLPARDLKAVAVKVESVARTLRIETLTDLHKQTPKGFGHLLGLSLTAFLPILGLMEKRSLLKVQKYVRSLLNFVVGRSKVTCSLHTTSVFRRYSRCGREVQEKNSNKKQGIACYSFNHHDLKKDGWIDVSKVEV